MARISVHTSIPDPASSLECLLEKKFSTVQYKKDIERIARMKNMNGEVLLQLAGHKLREIASRASWTFRTWAVMQKKQAPALCDKTLQVIEATAFDSVKRNLLGAILDTSCPAELQGSLIHLCMKLLGESGHDIAVYANALALLKPICQEHPELQRELMAIADRQAGMEEMRFLSVFNRC